MISIGHGLAPHVTVIIPVFNEGENVEVLMAEIAAVMDWLHVSWEAMWVNGGSWDETGHELQCIVDVCAQARALRLAHHCSQSAALWTGLKGAIGDVLVTLDGDGQHDPRDIPRLVAELHQADIVIGYRKPR